MHAPRLLALVAVGLLGLSPLASAKPPTSYADDARVRAFAQNWATEHQQHFASVWGVLRQAKRNDQVIQWVKPARSVRDKNWGEYRQRFITPNRIQRGLQFWQQHASALQRAEQRYGVEARIIIGILGVETIFGQHKGRVRTLDALTTLAFDFPQEHPRQQARATFFQAELSALLSLSLQRQAHALSWQGSYAGALGYPQFMPSSWLRWGVDFDGNGRVDLIGSATDAIGSVAHYLAEHGWQRGLPARWATTLDDAPTAARANALAPDILPTLSPEQLQAAGAQVPQHWPQPTPPLALVELHNGRDAPATYVIGTPNFYAITRYNQSSYYALAVIELGEAIAQARQTALKRPSPKRRG